MRNAKYLFLVALVACLSLSFVGCSDDDDPVTPPPAATEVEVLTVMSVATAADANPEIIRMVPGSDNKAVFVASASNQLFPITYLANSFTVDAPINLAPGSATAEMTSIDISPVIGGENYVAVCVAEVDCSRGWILLVKLSDGTIVATIEDIGYNPDGCAFTKDGEYLIVACEDDREDRPCKPEDRHGGSFSIIDLRAGVDNATLTQDYLVDWDVDSEPEHCETSSNGTVVVSVQETSQIVIFNTADLPLAEDDSDITIVDLPTDAGGIECEPDGLYISPDGTLALISNERNGTFQMMELPSGTMLGIPYIVENDFAAPPYNVDNRKATKRTEPEECSLIVKDGRLFAILALQESHAVIVYDVTDPANPVFDSIAPAGIDWANDIGMEASTIGSEGVAVHPTNGVVFSANEREGSITMYKSSWAQ